MVPRTFSDQLHKTKISRCCGLMCLFEGVWAAWTWPLALPVRVPLGLPLFSQELQCFPFLPWQRSNTDEHICILICVQDFWSLLPQRNYIKFSFNSPWKEKQRGKNRDGFLLPFALFGLLSVITVYHLLLFCSNIQKEIFSFWLNANKSAGWQSAKRAAVSPFIFLYRHTNRAMNLRENVCKVFTR